MQTAIFQYKSLVPDAPRGIYITLHGEDRKVYPYELFATLWDERNRRLLCEGVEAECRIFNNEVDCVFFDYKYGRYSIEYKRDSFILSADSALRQLCDDILNSRQTIYGDRYMKSAHAERMVEGLCAMNVHRNYNQSISTDAIIEKFTFKFEGEYACDTPFVIGIGNRLYRSYFSDWSNELDILRYELEGLVLRRKGSVNLHYEDEPNIIDVHGCYLHDTRDSSCVYSWKEIKSRYSPIPAANASFRYAIGRMQITPPMTFASGLVSFTYLPVSRVNSPSCVALTPVFQHQMPSGSFHTSKCETLPR